MWDKSPKLLGSKTIPKSTAIKLEAGDRNIYREKYIAFCNYKGKRHAMLLKRRKAEFALFVYPIKGLTKLAKDVPYLTYTSFALSLDRLS